MKIGIGLPNQVRNLDPRIVPRWAATAEEAGFSTLSTIGRYAYPGVSDTVALAAAAGATSRIGLLPTVMLAPAWPAHLLAKEVASIDGVSGGRLTLGIGLGSRPDDFPVEGFGLAGRGKRLDRDLEVYRSVWKGEPVGGMNPAVPESTREIPMLFGAASQAALRRGAREGVGFIGGAWSAPAPLVASRFEQARRAWEEAGRSERQRLVAIAYFAIGDVDAGRANVRAYYDVHGAELAGLIANNLSGGPHGIKQTMQAFDEIGVDELVFNPAVADLDEISRLAEITL